MQTDSQTHLLRRLSVSDRLQLSAELRDAAWQLRRAVLRRLHPDWSDLQLEDAVRVAFSNTQ